MNNKYVNPKKKLGMGVVILVILAAIWIYPFVLTFSWLGYMKLFFNSDLELISQQFKNNVSLLEIMNQYPSFNSLFVIAKGLFITFFVLIILILSKIASRKVAKSKIYGDSRFSTTNEVIKQGILGNGIVFGKLVSN